jgi:hypothetical protein
MRGGEKGVKRKVSYILIENKGRERVGKRGEEKGRGGERGGVLDYFSAETSA